MSAFLKQLMEQNQRLLNQTTGTGIAQKDLFSEINQLREQFLNTQETKNALAKSKVALDAAAELQVAEENRAAASAFGVNMDDPNNVVGATASIAREAVRNANTQVQTAEAKRNINLLDDPLGGIAAFFTVPMHEQEAGRQAQVALSASQRLSALNQAAQIQFKTNESMKRNVTVAAVNNAVEASVVAGTEAMLKLRENLMRTNVNDLVAVLQLDRAGLDLMMQAYEIQNNEERMQMARDAAAFQRAKHEKDLKDMRMADEAINALLKNVNMGRAVYGLPPMNEAEIRSYMQLGGKSKAMLDQWFDTGAVKIATGVGNIATDPASAQVLLTQAGVRYPEGDPRKQVQDLILQAQRDYKNTPQGKAATKAEEVLGGINSTAYASAAKQATNIKPNDLSNIYAALPFGTVVKNKEVQQSELYTVLLKAQEQAGIVDISPDQIVSQTAALVAAGKISIESAASGISNYTKAAIAANNASRQYQAFGLPNQTTYKTVIKTSPGGREDLVDLRDETQVTAALFKYQMAFKRNVVQEALRGIGPGPRTN